MLYKKINATGINEKIMKQIHKRLLIAQLALLYPDLVLSESFSFDTEVDVSVSNNDNLSRAWLERDVVDDSFVDAQLTVSADKIINPLLAVNIRGFVGAKEFNEVDTLSSLNYGLTVGARWQSGYGYTAPMYQISLTAANQDSDTEQRDHFKWSAQFVVNKRNTDRISSFIGLQHSDQESDHVVFDLATSRFFMGADYAISDASSVYASYEYQLGDAFSSAQRSYYNGYVATDILPLINIATAIELDDAFNEAFEGQWLVYRFDAKTHGYKLGFNYGLSGHSSIDASVMYVDVEADDDSAISYDAVIANISFLKRF